MQEKNLRDLYAYFSRENISGQSRVSFSGHTVAFFLTLQRTLTNSRAAAGLVTVYLARTEGI